jgi:hypothetical protein
MGCGCKNAEGGCGCGTKNAEGNYSAWKTLGDVTMYEGVGFPKIIDFKRSKKEQEAFFRVAEKIVKSKELNCTHCNPQGDKKLRHSVFILMATKPTSMKIKGDRTLKFKKGDIITLGKGCMNALYEDKSAEESAVQEPDWIPDGDGRAIGQQNFGINLSPLHAEDDEGRHICDECGKVADYNVQDVEYRWNLDEGEFTGKGESRHHIGDINDFYCEDCYHKSGYRAESFNAESRFDKLSNEIADEYVEKGMSPEKAQGVGDATAAKIGRAKYGKTGMRNMQKKGMSADMVGSPSPTFNENITGQDGPSENPTNAVFEGTKGVSYQGRYGAQKTDMDSARAVLKRLGYIKNNDDILRDVFLYNDTPSKKTGRKADKYHYFALIENDDGKYFAINVNGPSRSVRQVVNILGPTGDRTWKPNGGSADFTSTGNYRTAFDAWRKKGKEKTGRKGYRALLFGKDGNILDEDYGIFNAEESLAQIEGPTAEATTGGLHAPSSFAMTWEDGTGQSSASIPPNEIAWAENVKEADGEVMGMGLVGWASVAILGYFGFTMLKANKVFNAVSSRTENRKSGCGCGKSAETKTVRKDSEYSVSQINPVEVEGQNDVYGAEELHSPQTSANVSQPNWGPQATYRQNPRRNFKMW